jgi:hypothetical protein
MGSALPAREERRRDSSERRGIFLFRMRLRREILKWHGERTDETTRGILK